VKTDTAMFAKILINLTCLSVKSPDAYSPKPVLNTL